MKIALVLLIASIILWFMPAFYLALFLGAIIVIGFVGFLMSLLLIFL